MPQGLVDMEHLSRAIQCLCSQSCPASWAPSDPPSGGWRAPQQPVLVWKRHLQETAQGELPGCHGACQVGTHPLVSMVCRRWNNVSERLGRLTSVARGLSLETGTSLASHGPADKWMFLGGSSGGDRTPSTQDKSRSAVWADRSLPQDHHLRRGARGPPSPPSVW